MFLVDKTCMCLYNEGDQIDGGVIMKDALLNMLSKMDGHDIVAALGITLAFGTGIFYLICTHGYEIDVEKDHLSIRKATPPGLKA